MKIVLLWKLLSLWAWNEKLFQVDLSLSKIPFWLKKKSNSNIIMTIITKQSRWGQVYFKMSCCGAYVLSKNLSLRICSYGQNVVYPYISNWRDVRVLKGLRNEEWSIWKNVFYFLSEGDTCVRTSHVLIFWAKWRLPSDLLSKSDRKDNSFQSYALEG